MKKLSLTSVIIVFVFSLCYPMGPIAHCSAMNQKGDLACYCCSGTDKTCTMYVCSKCNHTTSSDHSVWFYDTLLSAFTFSVHFQPLILKAEEPIIFKALHCEVLYKPPKS